MAASAPVPFSTSSAPLTTTTLQRGLNGYAGSSDTFLNAYSPGTVWGNSNPLLLSLTTYTPLVRFSIFQSEGGPLPNGAVIQSAILQMYKQSYDDTLSLNALLNPWLKIQAASTEARPGTAWSVGGAGGAGSDYVSAAGIVRWSRPRLRRGGCRSTLHRVSSSGPMALGGPASTNITSYRESNDERHSEGIFDGSDGTAEADSHL